MVKLFTRLAREFGLMIRMRKVALGVLFITLLFLVGGSYGEDLSSPEATVSNYYNAIKSGRFEKAYEYTSREMRDGRSIEQWVEDWRKTFESGKVVILEFSVSPAQIEGDKATVKVTSKSRDAFNPKGITEHEIDHLVKENGAWKIDETEILMENL